MKFESCYVVRGHTQDIFHSFETYLALEADAIQLVTFVVAFQGTAYTLRIRPSMPAEVSSSLFGALN